ncbi:MAG: hypothetical protein ABIK43_06295 [candidate division WOR-3 bacterium]
MLEEIRAPAPPRPGWLEKMLPAVVIVWGFVGVYLLQLAIDSTSRARSRERMVQELAYFPSGLLVRQAAIEYQELAADIVWLVAINYYGHKEETNQRYEWLGHIFDVLTTLDPRYISAYLYGATVMADAAKEPDKALDLLYRGMRDNPMDWRLPFDAGFITYQQIRRQDPRAATAAAATAARLFRIAAKLPGSWTLAERFAPYVTAKAGDFATAESMYKDLYYSTENRKLREVIIRQVRAMKRDRNLYELQAAVDSFRTELGRLPVALWELRSRGYVRRLPEDPFGGVYYIQNGMVMVWDTTNTRRR